MFSIDDLAKLTNNAFAHKFKRKLTTLLDEAFARVNMDREEWDPNEVAEEVLDLMEDATGYDWRPKD